MKTWVDDTSKFFRAIRSAVSAASVDSCPGVYEIAGRRVTCPPDFIPAVMLGQMLGRDQYAARAVESDPRSVQ